MKRYLSLFILIGLVGCGMTEEDTDYLEYQCVVDKDYLSEGVVKENFYIYKEHIVMEHLYEDGRKKQFTEECFTSQDVNFFSVRTCDRGNKAITINKMNNTYTAHFDGYTKTLFKNSPELANQPIHAGSCKYVSRK